MSHDLRHEIANALRAQGELGLGAVPARWIDACTDGPASAPPTPPSAPVLAGPPATAETPPAAAATQPPGHPTGESRAAPPPALPATDAPAQPLPDDLAALRDLALGCRKCGLCETRTQVVFGVGNPRAALMFVGEAPGFDEDRQGEPFVGAAGQLLTRIIAAIELRREDVYIANILKCRPPNNRNPKPDEIALCRPYLDRQIELIRPRVICALGKFAAQTLLASDAPISRLRGRFHDYRGIPVMPTYHPAYLLRNPGGKRAVWEDMQQIQARLAGTPPE
ncbi:MAG TPA: uracil-DNA glycosylase [bacterium]|jgi:DNA polymerase